MEKLNFELDESAIDDQKQAEYFLHVCQKMKKLDLELDDDSAIDDQKQAECLFHACQCKNTDCRLPNCQKMKTRVQHTESCEQRIRGGCAICKQLVSLCCYHAKNCQEAKCSVLFCINIKLKLWAQLLGVLLQKGLRIRDGLRRHAAMQNCGMSGGILQSSENSNPSSQLSLNSAPPPYQLQPGMELTECVPAIQQLQARAKTPFVKIFCHNLQNLIIANFGENYPVVANNTGLITSYQQIETLMQNSMSQLTGLPDCVLNMGNAASSENSECVQNQQSDQDIQLLLDL